MRKKKKRKHLIHNLVLAAIEPVWMVPTMRKKKRRKRLMDPFLLTTRCSAIKAEKQETCLSLSLLICLINLGLFSHLCTHDICRQVRPKLCRTKNLMRSTPTSSLGWRRRDLFLAHLKRRNFFGLCFPCLNCVILDLGGILGFWGGLGFLLAFILGHFIPWASITILAGSLGMLEELRAWDSRRTQGSVNQEERLPQMCLI